MPQIGFDLEFDVEIELESPLAQLAAEFLGHRVVGKIGDVTDHAGDAQPALWHHTLRVVIAAVEIRVGRNRLARHLVECDVLRRQLWRGGNHDRMRHATRLADRPLHRLHRPQAAAHDGGKPVYAEPGSEPRLRFHPVFDGDHRKIGTPRLAGGGIDARGTCRAVASADVVDTHHEEPAGVDRLAGTNQVVPPAQFGRIVGIDAGDMVRSVERVADQHRVAARGIEGAVGFVRELVRVEPRTALQRDRFLETRKFRADDAD